MIRYALQHTQTAPQLSCYFDSNLAGRKYCVRDFQSKELKKLNCDVYVMIKRWGGTGSNDWTCTLHLENVRNSANELRENIRSWWTLRETALEVTLISAMWSYFWDMNIVKIAVNTVAFPSSVLQIYNIYNYSKFLHQYQHKTHSGLHIQTVREQMNLFKKYQPPTVIKPHCLFSATAIPMSLWHSYVMIATWNDLHSVFISPIAEILITPT